MMLRRSIAKCASFKFETCGTYVICGIYGFIACLQIVYMVSYEFLDNVIVYTTLMHFLSYFIIEVAVFIVLLRTGSGLQLVPHKLNNNRI